MAESTLPTTGEELDVKHEFLATATEESQVTLCDPELGVYVDTLRGIAKECLETGNKEYRQGEANNAINSYTEGLQVNCKDKRLNAKLYSNRAAAHFHLGNYQECLDDAAVAVQLEPTLIKAIKKGGFSGIIHQNSFYDFVKSEQCGSRQDTSPQVSMISAVFISAIKEPVLVSSFPCIKKQEAGFIWDWPDASLGCGYQDQGQFKTAIGYHQRHLEIAKEVGDKAGEGESYGNLGIAYIGLGQFKTAIGYHQRHLEIAKEVGDKAGEGKSYANLGIAYIGLGQFKTAIGYHQRHLEIAKEVGDKAGEGRSYANLGCAYQGLGQFKTAIGYHQRDLEIAKEVGDKAGEGGSYVNLGNAHGGEGKFRKAIEYYERNLKIAIEVGDKVGEEASYCNLGEVHRCLGLLKTATRYHHLALEIAKEVGDKVGVGRSFCLLGSIRLNQREFKAAIEGYERQLEIAKEVGDKTGEACSLCLLGEGFECLGNVLKAFVCFQSSVEVYDDIRASLQLNDQWKICYRDQHQTAYKGLWRTHLQEGNVVEALLAAEKGRAQSLRDLMDIRYQPGDSSTNSPSNNTFLSAVPSSTVFMAINGPCVYLWVILSNNNIKMRKVHVNSFKYEDDLKIFIEHLNNTALEEIGAKINVRCENPSLDSPKREAMASDGIPINVLYSKSRALQKLYEIIVTPIAELIEGRELTFVPEGPFCLVPFAPLEDSK
ncbi:Tetratricopeptide repeat protein 28 [Stylophora pistillata]|uniref:Tetratricopeptide repeat protein 28 n=1 Tax=Stylophora pistillata TaxID=50429 RepID=A0A2B4RAM6_STYPI|nr:Tetratricopeptide repeat protein 28 [Stylophora pistillata]